MLIRTAWYRLQADRFEHVSSRPDYKNLERGVSSPERAWNQLTISCKLALGPSIDFMLFDLFIDINIFS